MTLPKKVSVIVSGHCLKTGIFINAKIAEGAEFKRREFQSTVVFAKQKSLF